MSPATRTCGRMPFQMPADKTTVQTGALSMVVTYLSVLQVCRLFMHLRIGVSVFFQLLGFTVIILFLFFSLAPMFFFLNMYIEIYDDDNDDNEAQHLHGQSSFRIQTLC